MENEFSVSRERGYCARIGFALVAVMALTYLWQMLLGVLYAVTAFRQIGGSAYFALALVGQYVFALPIAFRIVRSVPREPLSDEPVSPMRFARWLAAGCAILWIGAWIGTAANNLVFALLDRPAVDILNETMDQLSPMATLLSACVLGPAAEEALFRGLIAGRLARYGQKTAIFASALLFGLFHGNLSQFFYAFGLGLLLGYVYLMTGRLRWPIALHMLFNLIGSGLIVLLPDTPVAIYSYGALMLALVVCGAVVLSGARGRIVLQPGSCDLSYRTVWGNAGMALALIGCLMQFFIILLLA